MYYSWGEYVRFSYVTSLRVEDINEIGNETASYKVLSLGNNVCSTDGTCFLTFYPSHLYGSPFLLLLTDLERTDSPRLYYIQKGTEADKLLDDDAVTACPS
jgi:hypothetical protein